MYWNYAKLFLFLLFLPFFLSADLNQTTDAFYKTIKQNHFQ